MLPARSRGASQVAKGDMHTTHTQAGQTAGPPTNRPATVLDTSVGRRGGNGSGNGNSGLTSW